MRQERFPVDGKTYALDDQGFLDPPEQWDEVFAESMAAKLGFRDGLTGEHWKLIRYLRKKFLRERVVPAVFFACADNRIRLKKLKSLFPMGYLRGACRIAGINFASFAAYYQRLSHEYIPHVAVTPRAWNPVRMARAHFTN